MSLVKQRFTVLVSMVSKAMTQFQWDLILAVTVHVLATWEQQRLLIYTSRWCRATFDLFTVGVLHKLSLFFRLTGRKSDKCGTKTETGTFLKELEGQGRS